MQFSHEEFRFIDYRILHALGDACLRTRHICINMYMYNRYVSVPIYVNVFMNPGHLAGLYHLEWFKDSSFV